MIVFDGKRKAYEKISKIIRSTDAPPQAMKYWNELKQDLIAICETVIGLVDKQNPQGTEETVFYLKMAADYNRYMSDYTWGA